jgi:hypothetical protein
MRSFVGWRGLAMVAAIACVAAVAVSCATLTGRDPAGDHGRAGSSAAAGASGAPQGKAPSSRPTTKPHGKPTPGAAQRAVAALRWAGTGSRTSKPILLVGDYVLRDTIGTRAGCHWIAFIDGWDTEPADEVMTNATGSTSNAVDLIRLRSARYTFRVVTSSCGSWSVTLARS